MCKQANYGNNSSHGTVYIGHKRLHLHEFTILNGVAQRGYRLNKQHTTAFVFEPYRASIEAMEPPGTYSMKIFTTPPSKQVPMNLKTVKENKNMKMVTKLARKH